MFIESDAPGDLLEASDADTMWKYLRPDYKERKAAFMLARHGCPHCARVKQMVAENDFEVEAIHIGNDLTMHGARSASERATSLKLH